MSFIITSDFELNKVAAPNMPLPPEEYNRQYFDQINYTVATLPSAVTSGVGSRSFVTDALAPTFGATVVTGGAVAVPVYSDGTNWKVG